jgi:HAD superfamily hydrolase (TIGR01509 family)
MSGARRGLFLDLDGTLADSLPALRRVYDDFLAQSGHSGSDAEFNSLNGPPLADIVARLVKAHGLGGAPEDWLARYRDILASAHAAAPPRAGAITMLERARTLGWMIAVVTSAPHDVARAWLRGAGLAALIDHVVGGDEVKRGKPDPEPYRLALSRVGCDAAVSLAVEDSITGAQAALGAGLPTWLLGTEAQSLRGNALYRGRLVDFDSLATRL